MAPTQRRGHSTQQNSEELGNKLACAERFAGMSEFVILPRSDHDVNTVCLAFLAATGDFGCDGRRGRNFRGVSGL